MIPQSQMTLAQHLSELRKRIIFCVIFFIISFASCYFLAEEIYQILLKPFLNNLHNSQNNKLIYTAPTEAFITYLKLSFRAALFFSFPIFVTQFYLFIAPALYKHEKKNILLIFTSGTLLFLLGGLFAYYFILPMAFNFLQNFQSQATVANTSFSIELNTKISEYLDFVTDLLFGFGVAFQLPIFFLLLIKIGVLSSQKLKYQRKYWVVIIFLLSSILTPPDIISQITLAIPMILMFEIALIIGKKFDKKC